jgi:hypothetical protein
MRASRNAEQHRHAPRRRACRPAVGPAFPIDGEDVSSDRSVARLIHDPASPVRRYSLQMMVRSDRRARMTPIRPMHLAGERGSLAHDGSIVSIVGPDPTVHCGLEKPFKWQRSYARPIDVDTAVSAISRPTHYGAWPTQSRYHADESVGEAEAHHGVTCATSSEPAISTADHALVDRLQRLPGNKRPNQTRHMPTRAHDGPLCPRHLICLPATRLAASLSGASRLRTLRHLEHRPACPSHIGRLAATSNCADREQLWAGGR